MVFLPYKLLPAALCCMLLATTVQAADTPEPSTFLEPQQVDAQRLVISTKRQQLQTGFEAENAACYQRFAVNNCLRDVKARQTTALADLQRQDMFLNDQDRKRRGAEELSRIEAKQTAAGQQELVERRAKVFAEHQTRTQAINQRQQLKIPEANAAAATAQATLNRLKSAEGKADAKQQKQVGAQHEEAKFRERQKQAEKRHVEHAQQQALKGPSTATSLPVPP